MQRHWRCRGTSVHGCKPPPLVGRCLRVMGMLLWFNGLFLASTAHVPSPTSTSENDLREWLLLTPSEFDIFPKPSRALSPAKSFVLPRTTMEYSICNSQESMDASHRRSNATPATKASHGLPRPTRTRRHGARGAFHRTRNKPPAPSSVPSSLTEDLGQVAAVARTMCGRRAVP